MDLEIFIYIYHLLNAPLQVKKKTTKNSPGALNLRNSILTRQKWKTIGQYGSVGCLNIYSSLIPSRS